MSQAMHLILERIARRPRSYLFTITERKTLFGVNTETEFEFCARFYFTYAIQNSKSLTLIVDVI